VRVLDTFGPYGPALAPGVTVQESDQPAIIDDQLAHDLDMDDLREHKCCLTPDPFSLAPCARSGTLCTPYPRQRGIRKRRANSESCLKRLGNHAPLSAPSFKYRSAYHHGAAQTATNWMGTPDGRPGWADYFVWGHCRLWDRTARSTRTAPATAPPVPSPPETPPAASSWRSAQTPPSPASSASSPPTYARQSTPPQIISRSLADGFCRGSLERYLREIVGPPATRIIW
jgi:hypothetical protein